MNRNIPLHSSLKTRRRKEKEAHQIQESLHLEIQREEMIEHHLTLNATIITRRVITVENASTRIMINTTTLEATTTSLMIEEEEMNEGITVMEEMKEEEEMFQVTMKKITILKISQDTLGVKVMFANNMNILLFLP